MDPSTCFAEILEVIINADGEEEDEHRESDRDALGYHLADLSQWVLRGGYFPSMALSLRRIGEFSVEIDLLREAIAESREP